MATSPDQIYSPFTKEEEMGCESPKGPIRPMGSRQSPVVCPTWHLPQDHRLTLIACIVVPSQGGGGDHRVKPMFSHVPFHNVQQRALWLLTATGLCCLQWRDTQKDDQERSAYFIKRSAC